MLESRGTTHAEWAGLTPAAAVERAVVDVRRRWEPAGEPRRRAPRRPPSADPGAAALVFQGRAISYGDLDDLADLTAAAFAGLGVGRGDRVALVAGNVPEFVRACTASSARAAWPAR